MGLYDSFPYTNFHEANLDWVIKKVQEAKAAVDSIQDEIDQFNADYAAIAAALNVSGNNVSIAGTMTANGFSGPLSGNVTGNLTGNVTGNVTGDVTGNASTATNATHATTADSATTATSAASATNAAHATSADSATTATTATTATSAGSADFIGIEVTTEPFIDLLVPVNTDLQGVKLYYSAGFTYNCPPSMDTLPCLLLVYSNGGGYIFELACFITSATDKLYFRSCNGISFTLWNKVDYTTVGH